MSSTPSKPIKVPVAYTVSIIMKAYIEREDNIIPGLSKAEPNKLATLNVINIFTGNTEIMTLSTSIAFYSRACFQFHAKKAVKNSIHEQRHMKRLIQTFCN